MAKSVLMERINNQHIINIIMKLFSKIVYFIIVIISLSLSSVTSFSQNNIINELNNIQSLLYDKKPKEAIIKLQEIESLCQASDDRLVYAYFLKLKGVSYLYEQNYDTAIDILNNSISIFESLNHKGHEYIESLHALAIANEKTNNITLAEKSYRKAILQSNLMDKNAFSELISFIYQDLGNLYSKQGKNELADLCFKEAKKLSNNEDWDYYHWKVSMTQKVTDCISRNDYISLAPIYHELADSIKRHEGICTDYFSAISSEAIYLRPELGQFHEALLLCEEIIETKDTYNIPKEIVCGAYCGYYSCLASENKFDVIDRTIKSGLDYLQNANVELYPRHIIYRLIGNGAYWKENYVHAIPYYEEYLSPNYAREQGNNYGEITNMLAVSYIKINQAAKAKVLLEGYLDNYSDHLNDSPEHASNVYHNLGRAYMLTNNKKKAIKYLKMSKELQLKLFEKVNEKTNQYIIECEQ